MAMASPDGQVVESREGCIGGRSFTGYLAAIPPRLIQIVLFSRSGASRNKERRTCDGCGVRDFDQDPTRTEPNFNRQTSTPQTARRVGSSAQSWSLAFRIAVSKSVD
jgi:hypothetical protein